MATGLGLPQSDVVSVDVTISPLAAALRNFGSVLILGSSPVIDTAERIREYSGITGVGGDFSVSDPEYKAAERFFAQSPTPSSVYIARWAQAATAATLHGGVLSSAQQAIANFDTIANGALDISVDGVAKTLSAIDLTAATSLPDVAAAVTTAFAGAATVVWNANYNRFEITSATSGAGSTLGYATAPGAGTDLGALLQFEQATASAPVDGIAPESITDAVNTVLTESNSWYALYIASSSLVESDQTAVADLIEAASPSRLFGITTSDSKVLDPTSTTDIAYLISNNQYKRTLVQYSSSDENAAISILGRMATVDFSGQNTTITLKFKQEPGVAPENLNVTQVKALEAKNANVFVKYANGTQMIEQGVMGNGYFIDEVHGLDWLQNYVQTNQFNVLYEAPTKIPQTDGGVTTLLVDVEKSMDQAVTNGLVAPGVWDSSLEFGALKSGDTLSKGYYAYAPPVASQPSAIRATRTAPTIQVACKLAGAVHFSNVLINVNR